MSIGTGLTVGTYIAPFLVENFKRHYPYIPINLQMYQGKYLVEFMRNKKFNVMLSSIMSDSEDFESLPFYHDELVLISPNSCRINNTISLNKLRKCPLVIREAGSIARSLLEKNLRKHGIGMQQLTIVMELFSNEAIKNAVEAGVGMGFVARSSIMEFNLKNSVFNITKVKGLQIDRFIYLVKHQSTASPELDLFFRFADSDLWYPQTGSAQTGAHLS
ncbi:MAG: LysR substrate-binding domain-containing protein [Peptococcaceae bacterium]